MSYHQTWLAEAKKDQYDAFLASLWSDIAAAHPAAPDTSPEGLGDLIDGPHQINFAIDKEAKFAALQWHTSPSGESGAWSRLEAFFVCPSTGSPKVGLRIASDSENHDTSPPAWWVSVITNSSQTANHKIPGFLQLVGILAAKGNISTSSAAMIDALAEAEYEISYLRQLADDQSNELRQLRLKVKSDWAFAKETGQQDLAEVDEAIVEWENAVDLSGLQKWADTNSDRIVILPRALYGAKKSLYESPSTIYAALELLAGAYREHRTGLLDKAQFAEAIAKAGVQLRGSFRPSTAGAQGHSYFVNYEGRRCSLDFHLVKGGGRDERYCLRIYFFWDDDIKKVVVGWLPSHLNNSLT